MRILVDTNILTRSAQPTHSQHELAIGAVSTLRARAETLCLLPQNFYELWVVCTRPVQENGLGMSPENAQGSFVLLRESFTLLEELPQTFGIWEELVVGHSVLGKAAHDARLAAGMKANGVDALLTFDEKHFARYKWLTVLAPAEIAKTAGDRG